MYVIGGADERTFSVIPSSKLSLGPHDLHMTLTGTIKAVLRHLGGASR